MATTRPNKDPSTRAVADDMPPTQQGEVLSPNFGWDEWDKSRDTVVAKPWTIWDALKVFSLRNLVFAMVLGILAAAGGAAVALKQPTVYSGKAQLIIDQPKAITQAKDNGPILKLAVLKVKYADLAKSPAIAGPAAQAVGISQDQMSNNIVVAAPPSDLLISVTSQASTRSTAQGMANAVGTSIINYADQEQARLGVAPTDRFNFSFVQQATSASKIQPTANRALQAAVGLGVIATVLAYVILQLLAPKPR
jgi:capsular polysaccharide biosynthesis protein